VETSGQPIANEILAYLVKHPEAQDTLEGITEWWLLEQRIRYAVAEVDGTLNNLLAEGLLMTRQCADGRTYYGLNRAKEREIRRYLREAQSARQTETETEADSAEPQN
jgi:hypothetical protein